MPPIEDSEPLSTDTGSTAPIGDATAAVESSAPAADAGTDVIRITRCDPLEAPEGDYIYQPIGLPGEEGIFGLDQNDPKKDIPPAKPNPIPEAGSPSFGGELRKVDGGGYTMNLRFRSDHQDKYAFVPVHTSALAASSVTETLLGFAVQGSCKEPCPLIHCDMTPGLKWEGFGSGKFGDAPFTVTLKFEYIDDGEDAYVNIEGERIDTWHVKEHRDFGGKVFGTQDNEYWFARKNGVLVKANLRTGNYKSGVTDGIVITFGTLNIEFKGHLEMVLTSMTPKPIKK